MQTTPARAPGRPRGQSARQRSGAYIGIRASDEEKQQLSDAGIASERGLSGEGRHRLATTYAADNVLDIAVELAFGLNKDLIFLLAEVVNKLAPNAEYLTDEVASYQLSREIGRALTIIRDPLNPEIVHESRVDLYLHRLGSPEDQWAKLKRKRLGAIGDLLIERHKIVEEVRAKTPPSLERTVALVRDHIALLARHRPYGRELPDYLANFVEVVADNIDWLAEHGAEPELVSELRNALVEATKPDGAGEPE